MQTPNLASLSIFSRWIGEKGASLGTTINLRCSLIITSAARLIRLSLPPQAIADKVPHRTRTNDHRRHRM